MGKFILNKKEVGSYHNSFAKYVFDLFFTFLLFILSIPLFLTLYLIVFIFSGSPVIFRQRRIGLYGKEFLIYKFRTMKKGSAGKQGKLKSMNEADGPVFKIQNDPRFTNIGKMLSRIGLDELPQFLNIIKGDMSLVGPRPLPVNEAKKLNKGQKIRQQVRPGIISTWVTKGSHKLKFAKWMKLDKDYVESGTLMTDLQVVRDSLFIILKSFFNLFA